MSDQSAEKEFEATEAKLQEARRKGDIPRSTEVTTFAVYLGFLCGLILFGGAFLLRLGDDLAGLLAAAAQIAPGAVIAQTTKSAFTFLLVLIGVPFSTVFLALVAQRGIVFSTDKLVPKLSRLSPIQNAKNKYGSSGLFEFLKSAFKMIIFAIALAIYLSTHRGAVMTSLWLEPAQISALIADHIVGLLAVAVVIATGIGLVDFMWQRAHFRKRMMMTRQDLKDDMKQTEGDPQVKQLRRQRAMEIAMNSMMVDAAEADVIVVNPTHYAIALKWDRESLKAPICVAKGVDEIAARIRQIANENAIPIKSDPPTARALHATVDIGDEIGKEHYQAVAAAIRFAEAIRQKARS